MKKLVFLILTIALTTFFTSCNKEAGSGILKLSLTDAPIDGADVTGVYITINEIQVHSPSRGWITMEDFEGPKKFNLLDLTRGESEILGSLQLEGGTYTQIRFFLDAPETGAGRPVSPGCYIEFADESTEPLFVPGGSQSGFKAVGAFRVPVNGIVELTADFDVRKSVHHTGMGSPRYILRPVIRLIVENQAGAIRGNVTNIPDDTGIVVYAYEKGTFAAEEANDPVGEAVRFPGAVSSDRVCELGVYKIAFLAEGFYDLVVTSIEGDEFGEVLGIIENIKVESRKTTIQNLDLLLLK
jgi:hypothetical protein